MPDKFTCTHVTKVIEGNREKWGINPLGIVSIIAVVIILFGALFAGLVVRIEAVNGRLYAAEAKIRELQAHEDVSLSRERRQVPVDTPLAGASKAPLVQKIKDAVLNLCFPPHKMCIPGPPGKTGSRGPRGKRGKRGVSGPRGPSGPCKKGQRGIMGPPGKQGKRGMMGAIGLPGVQGQKGARGLPGPRGVTGLKGDPGESISKPNVQLSPQTLTVRENQTAVVHCTAHGNPKPEVTLKRGQGRAKGHWWRKQAGGRRVIVRATGSDAGDYWCEAKNILGIARARLQLFVEAPPRLTAYPRRRTTAHKGSTVWLPCKAEGYPRPVIEWTRAVFALPTGRTTKMANGTLTILRTELSDVGMYTCKAKNKLGSVQAATILVVSEPPPPSKAPGGPATLCGTILRHDPNTKDMKTNFALPSGWTLCYIDQRDKARHATQCKELIVGLAGYNNYQALLKAGGNFGCWHGRTGSQYGPSYAGNSMIKNACRNNIQHTSRLSAWSRTTTTFGVCIRKPR